MTQVQTTLVALAGLVSICTSGVGPNPHASSDAPYNPCKYRKQHPACQERTDSTEPEVQRLHFRELCAPTCPREGLEFRVRVPDCFHVHSQNRAGSQESTNPCRISFWPGQLWSAAFKWCRALVPSLSPDSHGDRPACGSPGFESGDRKYTSNTEYSIFPLPK